MRGRLQTESGLGSSLICSLLLHAAFFAALIFFDSFPEIRPNTAPVYYVDLVNLPVANPRAGSPASRGDDGAPPPPAPAREKMTAPAAPPKKLPPAKPAQRIASRTAPQETDREFQDRLAKLERTVEGRHTDAAIDALRKKVGQGAGRSGMPGGTGTEAGSDYGSYIQSRLKDAFEKTISFRDRNPVVVLRLTIDRDGRVAGYRVEKSSGDAVFEDSVKRAVEMASENFPPPPGRREFQQGFIFKPQGVGKK
ncbi:MAG: TonB C-terminal domain-containing protein [Geobacteraceae bacterium]|nr:TonB C-terminal domain-containing protein [Geobacteraceae bacterium]